MNDIFRSKGDKIYWDLKIEKMAGHGNLQFSRQRHFERIKPESLLIRIMKDYGIISQLKLNI